MMIDPRLEHQLHRVLRVSALLAVVGVLVWAFMPFHAQVISGVDMINESAAESRSESEPQVIPVDAEVFDFVLWDVPPVPKRSEVKPRVPKPITLELLAISGGRDAERSVVMYDSQDDIVYTLDVGESIREFTVSEIFSDSITITVGSQVHRLTLDSEDAI